MSWLSAATGPRRGNCALSPDAEFLGTWMGMENLGLYISTGNTLV